MDHEYCVVLVYKQAAHLLPRPDALVYMVTLNGRFYTDGSHSALTGAKVTHVRFLL